MELKNLRELRKQRKIRISDMAKVLNVADTTYSRYEKGLVSMTPNQLKIVAKHLDISVDYILGIIDKPLPYAYDRFFKDEVQVSQEEFFKPQKKSGVELTEEEKEAILKVVRMLNEG